MVSRANAGGDYSVTNDAINGADNAATAGRSAGSFDERTTALAELFGRLLRDRLGDSNRSNDVLRSRRPGK